MIKAQIKGVIKKEYVTFNMLQAYDMGKTIASIYRKDDITSQLKSMMSLQIKALQKLLYKLHPIVFNWHMNGAMDVIDVLKNQLLPERQFKDVSDIKVLQDPLRILELVLIQNKQPIYLIQQLEIITIKQGRHSIRKINIFLRQIGIFKNINTNAQKISQIYNLDETQSLYGRFPYSRQTQLTCFMEYGMTGQLRPKQKLLRKSFRNQVQSWVISRQYLLFSIYTNYLSPEGNDLEELSHFIYDVSTGQKTKILQDNYIIKCLGTSTLLQHRMNSIISELNIHELEILY